MEFSEQYYYDFGKQRRENTESFFLENILRARLQLNIPTGGHNDCDEDTNVYMAGLLNATLATPTPQDMKPYVSSYDLDVQQYLENHPGASNEYVVYRENADFGLVSTTVFLGYEHKGSYHHRVLDDIDESGRVALYYRMAATALEHIRGRNMILVHTFESMASNMKEVVKIMRKVSVDYFEFIEHISEGSFFHLERELEMMSRYTKYQRVLDDFLKLYGKFQSDPTEEAGLHLRKLVETLKSLNPRFAFDESRLSALRSATEPDTIRDERGSEEPLQLA